jgi:DNA modification methylase
MVISSAKESPISSGKVILQDSRSMPEELIGKYDTVITSPPYPNRISYIRELRPYMYWLDYIETSTEASDLDWASIGGTWGSATSKLGQWASAKNGEMPKTLYNVATEISKAGNKSSGLMANYVLKYFEDMHDHLKAVYRGLSSGGSAHYIIGNSNFYGVTVPSETLYEDMMKSIGFTNVMSKAIRKRNSKKELFEFVVSAEKS